MTAVKFGGFWESTGSISWNLVLRFHENHQQCHKVTLTNFYNKKILLVLYFSLPPKIEKLISSPIDQCNLKRLFSVLLHRHDMSDRNLGFRWRQQRVLLRETSFLKKYRRLFPFQQSNDVYTSKWKEVFNLKQKNSERTHRQCGPQVPRDEKIL